MKFPFCATKALESLVFVANDWPCITAFHAANVFLFADKKHLNDYSRPVVGGTYLAQETGPVPDIVLQWFRRDCEAQPSVRAALDLDQRGFLVRATAKREPDLEYVAPSDRKALECAMAFCRSMPPSRLSEAARSERAWQEAPTGGEINLALLIHQAADPSVAQAAQEYAHYGVAS